MSVDDLIARSLERSGAALRLTLPAGFQGLPDTAHGGSVLAVFDALADAIGPRVIQATYRRRVPLGLPLDLDVRPAAGGLAFLLRDAGATLAEGRVAPASPAADDAITADRAGWPLPVSATCFACGVDNEIGLRVALTFDEDAVRAEYTPRAPFRRADGRVATAVLTALLDETAFWLGALATGESGMTTEVVVRVHRSVEFGVPLVVAGRRALTTPMAGDPRFRRTVSTIHDAQGNPVASGDITFVAVRGAARRLVSGMLRMNPREVLKRVFPAYV